MPASPKTILAITIVLWFVVRFLANRKPSVGNERRLGPHSFPQATSLGPAAIEILCIALLNAILIQAFVLTFPTPSHLIHLIRYIEIKIGPVGLIALLVLFSYIFSYVHFKSLCRKAESESVRFYGRLKDEGKLKPTAHLPNSMKALQEQILDKERQIAQMEKKELPDVVTKLCQERNDLQRQYDKWELEHRIKLQERG